MADLRTLAQAVVDTDDAHRAAVKAMRENRTSELELAMYRTDIARKRASNDAGMSVADARRILTALDAERDAAATSGDARGYARAMGEVEARCEAEAAGACPGDDAHGALHAVAEWARERLTAAAEKERE